jgi:mannose-6-phosphate isomerase-like protein (cupin superfamily)
MSEYTVMRATDAPDFTGDDPGAFLGYGRPMGATQLAFNMRVLEPGMPHIPPGGDPTWGHSHKTIEEVYLVLEGEITMKIGDDVITLGPRDAVLMQPATPRATRNLGDTTAVFAMISAKVDDPMAETDAHEGFWPV